MNTTASLAVGLLILVVVIVVGVVVGIAIHRRRRRNRETPAPASAITTTTAPSTPSPTPSQTNEPWYQYQQPPKPPPLPPALQCGDACQKMKPTKKMHVDQDVGVFILDAMQMFFAKLENTTDRRKFDEARRIVRGKYTVSYPAMGIRCCDPRDPDAPSCRLIELPPLKDVKNVFNSEFLPNVFIVDAQTKKRLYRIAAVEWTDDDQTAYPRVDILSEAERVVVTRDVLEKYVPSLEWTVISPPNESVQTGAQRTRMAVHVDDALVIVVKRLAKMVKMLHNIARDLRHMF